MTMPFLYLNRRSRKKCMGGMVSPGILGFQASDADAIGILRVPRRWDDLGRWARRLSARAATCTWRIFALVGAEGVRAGWQDGQKTLARLHRGAATDPGSRW